MGLRILTWNCQSLRGKIPEISIFLEKNFYHVILIQETWLNDKIPTNIPNFTSIRKDRTLTTNAKMSHGGVMVLIRKGINFKIINTENLELIESLFVRVTFNSRNITIGSIYNPSSLSAKESKSELTKLLSTSGHFIMAGDFNCKNSEWNNIQNNKKGTDLAKICNDRLIEIHFPDDPTLYPDGRGQPSIVDLVLSRGILGISKPISINDLSSDHRPVEFTIPISIHLHPSLKIKNFRRTNWDLYRSTIVEKLAKNVSIDSETDIENQVEILSNLILEAQDIAVPLSKPYTFRYPQSQEIKDLIIERNSLRKATLRNPSLKPRVNLLNRAIKYKTSLLNAKNFNERLSKLKLSDLSLHQFAKAIKKKKSHFPPLKSHSNKFAFSDEEKSNLIASTFEQVHQSSNNASPFDRPVSESTDRITDSEVNFPQQEKVTFNELTRLIHSLKIKKASGHDNIPNIALKALPKIAVQRLTEIFNSCLKFAYFPSKWKKGKIIAIPKPDKDITDPKNYRPITLLPMLGKLFERIILERLQYFEESHRIFIPQQFGFRSKHSTTQQIIRVMETISLRFNQNKSTAINFLDCARAFDTVWHEGLLFKMANSSYPNFLVKIVHSFLRNRQAFVSINNTSSLPFSVKAGVPQGSPLSPHLFNLFINDIPIPKNCKIAVFADDTALLSSIKNYNLDKLVDRLESGLLEIETHFSHWKMRLNKTKTQSILFTKSLKMSNMKDNHKINFNGTTLTWQPTARYLGMELDSKLTLRHHVDITLKKAQKALSTLYCFMRRYSRVKTRYKILMYKAYIRPTFTYAAPALANCAKTHLDKYQKFQNKCLRMALSVKYRTRITDLHANACIPTIREFIDKLTETFYESCESSDNKLIKNLGNYSRHSTQIIFKHKMPRAYL